ncbi:MAG: response regulator [Candidatus Omnitrophica bacterium]|nr:response regulator [Candidatus Omnitrophota bacterium]MDD5671467.1 response regulator [Candidatus Omnitrophota bacterium]
MTEKKKTVLVVDDEKPIVAQIFSYLKSWCSYEPIATVNPAIVEKVLDTCQVQLIVADLRMPNISGFDIIKMVRAKGLHIPFVIITAYLASELPKLKEFGLTEADVVEKPFEPEMLESKISQKLKIESAFGKEAEQVFVENEAKVMIVDDEQEIAEIFATTLREDDYQVTTFGNGKVALEHLKQHAGEYHVAVIDMAIPGLLGHLLIEELLKLNPKIEIIPISARYPDSVKEQLKSVGFDPEKLVTKPFDLTALIDQIREYAVKAGVYKIS